MNRPKKSITDAINIALRDAGIENDAPFCVRAVYEDGYFALTIYTLLQKYDFYVHGASGEVTGMISEPYLCPDLCSRFCA